MLVVIAALVAPLTRLPAPTVVAFPAVVPLVIVPPVVAVAVPVVVVVLVLELALLIPDGAAPGFVTAELPEIVDLAFVPAIGLVAATIVRPVDDDPLKGEGRPVFAAERVTGALVGEDGCFTTALTIISPNCSVVVSRPSVLTGNSKDWVRGAGCCPRTPGAASRFWFWRAVATSVAVMPSDASFCGSSQARML